MKVTPQITISKEIIDLLKLHTSTLGEAHHAIRHVELIILKKIIKIGEETLINQSGSEPLI